MFLTWNQFKLLSYGMIGVFSLDLDRNKLAKGYFVVKKARDKDQVSK